MEQGKSWTPLDKYDYSLDITDDDIPEYTVWIKVDSLNDIEIADISGKITATDDRIYVEGHYLHIIDGITVLYANNSQYLMVMHAEEEGR